MINTVIDGAQELLVETVSALSAAGENQYIVIGGWCPYLRNTSGIEHPGTLDVDILFKEGYQDLALDKPIKALLKKGFLVSAKHGFQLLIEKQVGTNRLIYNVDLLHPLMNDLNKTMFVDQLDLDIPIDTDRKRVKAMQSIVQPNSAVLFERKMFSSFSSYGVEFNLVDFTGMFITKMDSCQKQKRERDSFDIYIGFKSDLVSLKILQDIKNDNEMIANSINNFIKFLNESDTEFNKNVFEFCTPPDPSPANYIYKILVKALQK